MRRLPQTCYPRLVPPPAHYRFQFGLRTVFVAMLLMAVPAAWVGSTLNWIRAREAGRVWIEQHRGRGIRGLKYEARPSLPWSLCVFNEKPLHREIVAPNYAERFDLTAYRAQVVEIERLFPETQIVDVDAHDRIARERIGQRSSTQNPDQDR